MTVTQKYYTHHIVNITLCNSFDPVGGVIVGPSVNLLVYKSSKMKIILITPKQTHPHKPGIFDRSFCSWSHSCNSCTCWILYHWKFKYLCRICLNHLFEMFNETAWHYWDHCRLCPKSVLMVLIFSGVQMISYFSRSLLVLYIFPQIFFFCVLITWADATRLLPFISKCQWNHHPAAA